nr:hypothetical protein GCM10025699_71680 [Microbacterium flavescens]
MPHELPATPEPHAQRSPAPRDDSPIGVGESVGIVFAAGLVGLLVGGIAAAIANHVISPGMDELAPFLVALAGAFLLNCVVAVVVVVLCVRNRPRGRRFATVFAGTLGLLVVLLAAMLLLGTVVPGALGTVSALGTGLVIWPVVTPLLLWSCSAAAAGVVRPRSIGYAAGAGLVVAVIILAGRGALG